MICSSWARFQFLISPRLVILLPLIKKSPVCSIVSLTSHSRYWCLESRFVKWEHFYITRFPNLIFIPFLTSANSVSIIFLSSRSAFFCFPVLLVLKCLCPRLTFPNIGPIQFLLFFQSYSTKFYSLFLFAIFLYKLQIYYIAFTMLYSFLVHHKLTL